MNEIANEWLISRNIIADFLRELRPDQGNETHQRNAAAIIARLAQHEPPILTGFARPEPKPDAELLAACEMLAKMHALDTSDPTEIIRPIVVLGSEQLKQLNDAIAKAKGGA